MFDKAAVRRLGIDPDENNLVNKVEDLLNETPKMILMEVAHRNKTLRIDGRDLKLTKGSILVMPLGYMESVKKDVRTGQINLKPHTGKKFSDYYKRYYGQDLTNKKLLIWRTGGIGDLMFAQPIVKYLKEKYPSTTICFATAPRFLPLFKSWPKELIDEYLTIPFDRKFLWEYDYHLTFEGVIERCKEAHQENAYDLFSRIAGLNINMNNKEFSPTLIPEEEIIKNIRTKLPNKFIILQLKASSPLRMMSHMKWVNIIKLLNDKYGLTVAFLDQPSRTQAYETLIRTEGLNKEKVLNLCEISKDINYAIAIMSLSQGMIGVDSSFNHLGNALGIPTLGLFGPFRGDLRMRYYPNGIWIDSINSKCEKWPCFYHQEGQVLCPYTASSQFPECMDSIDEQEVVEKFDKLLRGENYGGTTD